jgi:hypothetical protein
MFVIVICYVFYFMFYVYFILCFMCILCFMYFILLYCLCIMYCICVAMLNYVDRGSFVINRLVRGEASRYMLATHNNAKPAPAPA